MKFATWLEGWMGKNRLRTPSYDRERFAVEVMRRVRAEARPQAGETRIVSEPARPFPVPWLANAWVPALAAAVLIAVVVMRSPGPEVAQLPPEESLAVLQAVDAATPDVVLLAELEEMAVETDEAALMLAQENQDAAEGAAWIERMMLILDSVDEDGEPLDEEVLLDEIDLTDETLLAGGQRG